MTNTQMIQMLRKLQIETADVTEKAKIQRQINKIYDNMPAPVYS